MIKKIFILSLIILGIVLFFWGVYNLAFKKNTSSDFSNNADNAKNKNSDIFAGIKQGEKSGIISAVTEEGAIRAAYVKDTDRIRYYAVDGKVWEVGMAASEKKNISEKDLPGLKDVFWSPDGVQVITSFSKNDKSEFFTYNYKNNKGIKLKDGLDATVWDAIGAKIVYKYFDQKTGVRTLNIANPDGSEWKKLADVSFKDMTISAVPQSSLISFWNSPKAVEETNLQIVGTEGGEVQKVFSGKYGADYLWSPNGQKALISSLDEKNSKKVTLGIVDRNGSYSNLGIPTFVSKCVWSYDNKTVYFALPGDIPADAVIPDEYMQRKFYTTDTFWKLNVETGKKERIVELENMVDKYDASKMFLSENEDALFFINKVDRKVYRIKL